MGQLEHPAYGVPTAAIGMPSNLREFMEEGETLRWVGRPLQAETFHDLDPEHLGRFLVDLYWTLDANIEHWWATIVKTGDGTGTGTGDGLSDSIAASWAYVGTPKQLVIMYWDEVGEEWWIGTCGWDEDPVETVFIPYP